MKTIQVQAPGLLTTVQDLGRPGFGPIGVSPSGAADPISLRIGNRLVANKEGAAALEMMLLGGTFVFPEGAILALTGSDFGATLDDVRVNLGASVEARPGQTLRLGPTSSGARCYLCVQGGIAVKSFLGSASTHILSGLGGFEGRPLRKGDVLRIGRSSKRFRSRKIAAQVSERLYARKVLRVTPGTQADWFSESSLRAFYGGTYRVGEQSNRMGLRLDGPRHLTTRRERHDHRGRFARRHPSARRRLAHHPFCRAANHGRLSENRERDFRGPSPRRTTSPAR